MDFITEKVLIENLWMGIGSLSAIVIALIGLIYKINLLKIDKIDDRQSQTDEKTMEIIGKLTILHEVATTNQKQTAEVLKELKAEIKKHDGRLTRLEAQHEINHGVRGKSDENMG